MRISVAATALLFLTTLARGASAQVCVKPWAIADKWIDNHDETEPIDHIWTPDDTFETVDAHGNPLPDADVYIGAASPDHTGFTVADVGRQLWLKVGDPSATAGAGWFFAADVGGAGASADAYRTAIATCDPDAPVSVHIGDSLPILMGNLQGPTVQGALDLISQDPSAFWNASTNSIAASCAPACAPVSPRLAVVPVYDPANFEQSRLTPGGSAVVVSNFVGVFIEGYMNGYVFGVLTPIVAN